MGVTTPTVRRRKAREGRRHEARPSGRKRSRQSVPALIVLWAAAVVVTLAVGGCGRDAVETASRPADPAANTSASGSLDDEIRPPASAPLIGDPAALAEHSLPTRVVRLPGWWSPIDATGRYLAVNRVPEFTEDGTTGDATTGDATTGHGTTGDGAASEAGVAAGDVVEEHYLLDLSTGRRHKVLSQPVSGAGWWSMARALSSGGWTVWEEVHGLGEDRWRLYGARFDRATLELKRPRLLFEGRSADTDRCHFSVYDGRLIATTNSYDGDTSWGSRGWLVAVDIETGAREVLYQAPVSVGRLCVADDGTAAFVEYTDPDDIHSARLVVVRLADGEVLLRHRYRGGPVRAVAWDGTNLAWEADGADEEAGGCYVLLRSGDGTVHHVYDDGLAPALSGGHLFLTDYAADSAVGSTLIVRISDLTAWRMAGRGSVAPPTASLRNAVVTSRREADTVVRVGRVE